MTDTFPKEVPRVLQSPVTISPDLYLLPNRNNTILIDSNPHTDEQTELEIQKCNVVVLVYDVNNFDIIKRVRTYWVPKVISINSAVPIIMCGNKIDLRSSQQEELESLLTPNFIEFKQVEMGLECSAKGYLGLIDMISCA